MPRSFGNTSSPQRSSTAAQAPTQTVIHHHHHGPSQPSTQSSSNIQAAQQKSSGGMFSGIGSTVVQGMAFGAGSEVAHQAIKGIIGSGSSSGHSQQPVQQQQQQQQIQQVTQQNFGNIQTQTNPCQDEINQFSMEAPDCFGHEFKQQLLNFDQYCCKKEKPECFERYAVAMALEYDIEIYSTFLYQQQPKYFQIFQVNFKDANPEFTIYLCQPKEKGEYHITYKKKQDDIERDFKKSLNENRIGEQMQVQANIQEIQLGGNKVRNDLPLTHRDLNYF